MSIKSEVTRINNQVSNQNSNLSTITSQLNSKLGLSVSPGNQGTPLEKNSTTLTNIKNALGSYTPTSIKTYTETLYNWDPSGSSNLGFSIDYNSYTMVVPVSKDGYVRRVISWSTTNTDYGDYINGIIVINGHICIYGDFYGNSYNVTVTYEAMS